MSRLVLASAVAVVLAGCGFGGPETAAITTTVPPASVTYVAVGGAETVAGDVEEDRGAGYSRVLFRDHLPTQTVFTMAATTGGGVSSVLGSQIDEAVEIGATVVTIWIDEDLVRSDGSGVDPAAALADALARLKDAGADVAVTAGPTIGPLWTRTAQSIVADSDASFVDLGGATDDADIARRFADALGLAG